MELIKPKAFICALILLFSAHTAFGQTWGEIFNQKKTQKKYLLQQIAALQVYIGYAKKGYDIVGSGLNTVKDITNGEFGLHGAFFSSLKTVSPVIRNHAKVADIIAMQLAVSKAFNGIKNSPLLSLSNQLHILEVKDRVITACLNDLEELLLVITSGRVEMSDEERIRRLENINLAMREKSAFVQSFTADIDLFIRQKTDQQKSINQLRRLYENDR